MLRPVRWGHAQEEKPEKWKGSFLAKEEAVSAGRNAYDEGESFYVCSGELAWGQKYMIDADAVETCLWDAAYTEAGEAAEGFPDLTPAAKRELTQLLDIWATKHVKANFWIAESEIHPANRASDAATTARGAAMTTPRAPLSNKFWAPRPEAIEFVTRLVPDGSKVLEIGPGAVPFAKATHFVDRFPYANEAIRKNQAVVDVTKEPLPFADKSFDFVYCRHVVEDLYNPFLLLKEMDRVGKAGYIETPSPMCELTKGVDGGNDPPHRGYIHHRSFVWVEDAVLYLVEKATAVEHMAFDAARLLEANPFLWNTYFLWSGKLKFHFLEQSVHFTYYDVPAKFVYGSYADVLNRGLSHSIIGANRFEALCKERS